MCLASRDSHSWAARFATRANIQSTPSVEPAAPQATSRKRAGRSRKSRRAPSLLIGWREWGAFPELGVDRIEAKIDTGAKSSAIHAFKVRETVENGEPMARFVLHPARGRRRPEVECVAPLIGRRTIRSSNGMAETRPVIETTFIMGARRFLIDLTLTNRDAMGFRLLIGRDALRKRFTIDPGASHLLGEPDVAPAV